MFGNGGSYGSDGYVVRLRGLPWSVGQEEVANFLTGCNVLNVNFTFTRDGRPSGEAYVELSSESDVEQALNKNQQHMGKRYIEVFRSKASEMEYVLSKDGPGNAGMMGNTDSVVRLRGLPFSCTHDDISSFFKGMTIVPNGIALLADHMGRASGEAYVQFGSQAIADLALQKHKERMGTRYVEIFKSSMMEAENAIAIQGRYDVPGGGGMSAGRGGRPSPYDRPMGGGRGGVGMRGRGGMGGGMRRGGNLKGSMGGGYMDDGYDSFGGNGGGYGEMARNYGNSSYGAYGSRGGMGRGGGGRGAGGMGRGGRGGGAGAGMMMSEYESTTGHSVHMRGLPYQATESDIMQFFAPLNAAMVVIQYNEDGRPSGEADVDFNSHREAEAAMKKHKALMERRYIELFLNSVPDDGGYGGGASAYQQGGYGLNAGW